MFVMMAWGRIMADAWDDMYTLYREKVTPVTRSMPGMQGRQIWRGAEDRDETVFWSIWESLEALRDYERSDARRDLAREAERYFHPMAYAMGESWIKHFEVISATERAENPEHLLLAWGKLRLGAWNEYEQFYRQRVEPTAGAVAGLRERQLLRSTEDPDEGMSVSVWESAEALAAYEQSELRRNLATDVEHLYRGQFWVKRFQVTDDIGRG